MPTLQELSDALLKPDPLAGLLAGFDVESLLARRPERPAARRRSGPVSKQRPPTSIGVDYARALQASVVSLERMVGERYRDGMTTEQARAMLAEVEAEWLVGEGARLGRMVPRIAERVSDQQEAEFDRQLAALGIDPAEPRRDSVTRADFGPELARVGQAMAEFQRENVSLITSIPKRALRQVGQVIVEGLAKGRTPERIGRDIAKRFKIAKSRAVMIARDQTFKLHGQLNQARQEAAGITSYRWRITGSPYGDGRVRAAHRRLEGTVHRWDDPPVVDPRTGRRAHPGHDYNCRCSAEPVVPEATTTKRGRRRR